MGLETASKVYSISFKTTKIRLQPPKIKQFKCLLSIRNGPRTVIVFDPKTISSKKVMVRGSTVYMKFKSVDGTLSYLPSGHIASNISMNNMKLSLAQSSL